MLLYRLQNRFVEAEKICKNAVESYNKLNDDFKLGNTDLSEQDLQRENEEVYWARRFLSDQDRAVRKARFLNRKERTDGVGENDQDVRPQLIFLDRIDKYSQQVTGDKNFHVSADLFEKRWKERQNKLRSGKLRQDEIDHESFDEYDEGWDAELDQKLVETFNFTDIYKQAATIKEVLKMFYQKQREKQIAASVSQQRLIASSSAESSKFAPLFFLFSFFFFLFFSLFSFLFSLFSTLVSIYCLLPNYLFISC